LNNVQLAQAGNYSVLVSNLVDSVISSNAVLIVNTPVGTCATESVSQSLINGGFEQGLNGWLQNSAVYIIGVAGSQPIGVDGSYAADLGGGNVAGSKMWQSVAVVPGAPYELSFYSAANAASNNAAVGKVEIEDADGVILASQTFTNVSKGPMLGTNGFGLRKLSFTVGSNSSCLTIRFLDLTPNGGVGIDLAIDGVALKKIQTGTCATGTVAPSLNNGGFEQQLTGWSYTAGMFCIGHAGSQPIGVDGSYAADLGGGDVTGTKLWQSVAVVPGAPYELSFYSAANAASNNAAVGKVEIEDADGVILASQTFTNVSKGPMLGTNGFGLRKLSFTVGSNSSCLTIRFLDLTPNGGVGIDLAIDGVALGSFGPPVITSQPTNRTVVVGQSATFSVTATGTAPLRYQWRFNGTNIVGATNTLVTLNNVQLAQAGNYSVLVSNLVDSVISSNAVLTVNTPVCVTPPSGLVGWWAGEGDATDSAGLNNGILEGGLSFTNGEVGQAFFYNNTNMDVKVPASASLNVGTNSGFTIECWVNPTSASINGNVPLVEWNDGSYWGVHFAINYSGGPGDFYANVADSGGGWHFISSGAGVVVSNVFQHLAVTYDKATGLARLYRNGLLVAQQNLGSYTPRTGFDLYLGRRVAPASDASTFSVC
jgi:hypothetical protein